ncbi:MAG: T9SS type A sorting domain-containing protein [Ignavibacteria bacterium]
MKIYIKASFVFLFVMIAYSNAPCQSDYTGCGSELVPNESSNPSTFFGGKYKPERSNIGNPLPINDYFPIIVVFVQFQNEPYLVSNDSNAWPSMQAPNYINKVIAPTRNSTSNWWDAYNSYNISDYWHEFSRGKMHVIGKAISIILHDTIGAYSQNPEKINREIYDSLKKYIITSEWLTYDHWKYNSDGNFSQEADGRVDMIYMVFRQNRDFLLGNTTAGLNYLGECDGASGNEYTVYSSGSTVVKIHGTSDTFDPLILRHGSGIRVFTDSTSLFSRHRFLDLVTHEHGHHFFGNGHRVYCKMAYGGGRFGGWEFSLSPWELIKLGYVHQEIADFTNTTHYLYDYSSRGQNGLDTNEILQVPISSDGNQFFLISNRRKLSQWDRRMGGDTLASKNWEYLKNINPEYGKGLYIYHILKNGYEYKEDLESVDADLECADGLWSWESSGVSRQLGYAPFNSYLAIRKKYPGYDNDTYTSNSLDEMSVFSANSLCLFSPGSTDNFSSSIRGTHSLYTNSSDYWYSNAVIGDRWDAWNVGYNEIFSPYSSPNTKNMSNNQTGIFIWYQSLESNTNKATLKIYRTLAGEPLTEDSILHLTPPSRPMGLRVLSCDSTPTINGYQRIRLRWFHNMEPDMINSGNKKYKIYCDTSYSLSIPPSDAMQYSENFYRLIATVNIPTNSIPDYIDSFKISSCYNASIYSNIKYPVRYRVQAVDKFNDVSVLSDFVKTTAWSSLTEEQGDNIQISENEIIPKEYALRQNYPNPFNPVTNIQYDLPIDIFVTIKVYDLIGREVMSLVNEIKEAGSYVVSLNGSNLSSGIYYYKITAGSYEQVRKMILIK